MENNGCPTHLLVIGYVGKRIIMQLMFSLFGKPESIREIDDTQTASKDLAPLGLFLTVLGHQFHYSLKTEH